MHPDDRAEQALYSVIGELRVDAWTESSFKAARTVIAKAITEAEREAVETYMDEQRERRGF